LSEAGGHFTRCHAFIEDGCYWDPFRRDLIKGREGGGRGGLMGKKDVIGVKKGKRKLGEGRKRTIKRSQGEISNAKKTIGLWEGENWSGEKRK